MCRCDDICVITFIMYRCRVGSCKRCEHNNICCMVYDLDVDFVIYYAEGE